MLGVEAIPALLYFLLTLNIPDSPRWQILFQKNDTAALATLEIMYVDKEKAQAFLNKIKSAEPEHQTQKSGVANLSSKAMVLAFLLLFSINCLGLILYFTMLLKYLNWQASPPRNPCSIPFLLD